MSAGRRMSDDESEDEDLSDTEVQPSKNENFEEDFKIDPRDETAFNAFMNTNVEPRKTLADLVKYLTYKWLSFRLLFQVLLI